MTAYVSKALIMMEIIVYLAIHNKGYYRSHVIQWIIAEMEYDLLMKNAMMGIK